MYKYFLVLLAIAPCQAVASMAVVTCDGSTTQGTLTASCNDGFSSASVIAASTVANNYPDILDLNASWSASASFTGGYELFVHPVFPWDGGLDGWFALNFSVGDWSHVSISLNGSPISQGGSTLLTYTNGEASFYFSVSATGPDSVQVRLFNNLWTPSGTIITPDYQLTANDVMSPEPSGFISMCSGLLLLLGGARMRLRVR